MGAHPYLVGSGLKRDVKIGIYGIGPKPLIPLQKINLPNFAGYFCQISILIIACGSGQSSSLDSPPESPPGVRPPTWMSAPQFGRP
jgi:hypothetical protein